MESPEKVLSRSMLYYTDATVSEENMARVTLVEPDVASPEVKEIYEKVLKGTPASVHKAMAHRPEVLKNFLPFYGSVGRLLDRKLYEGIYIRVAWLNGCNY